MMKVRQEAIEDKNKRLFAFERELDQISLSLLNMFDDRRLKLFSIPPHKRIFLFFLTRALKTHQAIKILCREGFGQDAAVLLRSLLENLISFRYVLHHSEEADALAARFVAYKWVIFHRHLWEQEREEREKGDREYRLFVQRKELILKNFEEFKTKYHINSGRGLLTWSGRTVKDMAGIVSKDLLKEYESMFRTCSKFTHPSIISDKEYMVIDDEEIVFSVSPSLIGVEIILSKNISYTFDVLSIFAGLFQLKCDVVLNAFERKFKAYQASLSTSTSGTGAGETAASINRESIIVFEKN
ncbi:MAG: DUF5677 domain-containing protein [Candidatus Omnitrophota bacterium]